MRHSPGSFQWVQGLHTVLHATSWQNNHLTFEAQIQEVANWNISKDAFLHQILSSCSNPVWNIFFFKVNIDDSHTVSFAMGLQKKGYTASTANGRGVRRSQCRRHAGYACFWP